MLDTIHESTGGYVLYDGQHSISFYKYDRSNLISPIGEFICNTWNNLYLLPTSRPIVSLPEVKTYYEELENQNGSLDLSTAVSKRPVYQNRTGSFSFYVVKYAIKMGIEDLKDTPSDYIIRDTASNYAIQDSGRVIEWNGNNGFARYITNLCKIFHGKELIMILDDDPNYFYKGRFKIESFQSANDGSGSGVVINYTLDPFKYFIPLYTQIGGPTLTMPEQRAGSGDSPIQPADPYSFVFTLNNNSEDILKFMLDFSAMSNLERTYIDKIVIEYGVQNPELGIDLQHRIKNVYSFENLKYIILDEAYVSNFNSSNQCTILIYKIGIKRKNSDTQTIEEFTILPYCESGKVI